jgi:hypothetical protein
MRLVSQRRLTRVIRTLASCALVGVAAVPAPPARAANGAPPGLVPAVVRDVKTGSYRLGTTDPRADTPNYIQPDTQVEPSLAVNPKNPLNAVAMYQEGRIDSGGDATNGYATTFDGGQTWQYGEIPGLTRVLNQGGPWERASDAVVAFGPNNTVYANSLVFDNSPAHSGIAVNVSKDGGATWSKPVFLQDDTIPVITNDKNWIVVDNGTGVGHHTGRVYVVWDRVAPVIYSYCDANCDQVSNWTGFQQLPYVAWPAQGLGAYPVVMPDGSLAMEMTSLVGGIPIPNTNLEQPEFDEAASNIVFLEAPAAGAVPWPAPLAWTPIVQIAADRSAGVIGQRGGGIPSMDVDPSNGNLYVTWEDGRFRSDNTNDAVLSKSTDGGITWTRPKRINGGSTTDHIDHYMPAVAVGEHGVVHIAYKVRDESPGAGGRMSPYIDAYYQESYDGGETFTAPLKVNKEPSQAGYGAYSRAGLFEGDYFQIASVKGYTYYTRTQAAPAYAGEPKPLDPDLRDARRGHQHQSNWVALIRDLNANELASLNKAKAKKKKKKKSSCTKKKAKKKSKKKSSSKGSSAKSKKKTKKKSSCTKTKKRKSKKKK